MSKALSATDLMPLVFKLTPNERLKLAELARRAASVVDDASAYRAFPPAPETLDRYSAADVKRILTPEGSLAARRHVGGTAPAQVAKAIARARKRVG